MSRYTIVCDSCGMELPLDSVAIETRSMVLDEGPCDVVFFSCQNPSCRRVNLVSVEDQRLTELKRDLKQHLSRMQLYCKNHGGEELLDDSVYKNFEVMKRRKQARISNYTDRLIKKYEGRFTLVSTENNTEDLKLDYHE